MLYKGDSDEITFLTASGSMPQQAGGRKGKINYSVALASPGLLRLKG